MLNTWEGYKDEWEEEEQENTVKFFMETYEGFDWENGTIVIVEKNRPHLFKKGDVWYNMLIPMYENKIVMDWTNDDNVMVITV